jgi:hypothetical protein
LWGLLIAPGRRIFVFAAAAVSRRPQPQFVRKLEAGLLRKLLIAGDFSREEAQMGMDMGTGLCRNKAQETQNWS